MVGWPNEKEKKGKKDRETHYNEETYGHGLKVINGLRNAMENKIKKKYNRKTVRGRELLSNGEHILKNNSEIFEEMKT